MQETENITLQPILEPSPVAFTMETLGWKILFVGLIIFLVYLMHRYYIHYQNNAYRRSARSNIQQIVDSHNESLSVIIVQIMFQLKQTAIQSFGRKKVASLKGDAWLDFLDKHVKGLEFLKFKDTISQAVYLGTVKDESLFNKEEFIKSSLLWIKKHAR